MLEAEVVAPAAEGFPGSCDKSSEAVGMFVSRFCLCMGVKGNTIQLEIFPGESMNSATCFPFEAATAVHTPPASASTRTNVSDPTKMNTALAMFARERGEKA